MKLWQTWEEIFFIIISFLNVLCIVGLDDEVVPSENDPLNTLMLQWHNEARRRVRDCLIPGQPGAQVLSDLVRYTASPYLLCCFIFLDMYE